MDHPHLVKLKADVLFSDLEELFESFRASDPYMAAKQLGCKGGQSRVALEALFAIGMSDRALQEECSLVRFYHCWNVPEKALDPRIYVLFRTWNSTDQSRYRLATPWNRLLLTSAGIGLDLRREMEVLSMQLVTPEPHAAGGRPFEGFGVRVPSGCRLGESTWKTSSAALIHVGDQVLFTSLQQVLDCRHVEESDPMGVGRVSAGGPFVKVHQPTPMDSRRGICRVTLFLSKHCLDCARWMEARFMWGSGRGRLGDAIYERLVDLDRRLMHDEMRAVELGIVQERWGDVNGRLTSGVVAFRDSFGLLEPVCHLFFIMAGPCEMQPEGDLPAPPGDVDTASWTHFVRALWPIAKGQSYRTYMAYVSEADVFQKLSGAGIRVVRSFEGAPVDGAFVVASHDVDMPPQDTPHLEMWEWASRQQAVVFMTFDVKSVGLRSLDLKGLSYAYTNQQDNENQDPDMYVLVFEDVADYLALVPKGVWETSREFAYGVEPLVNRIPAWCQPFMVATEDLAAAVSSFVHSGKQAPYINPTTDVTFHGLSPRTTTDLRRLISPQHERMAMSMAAILFLRTKVRECGGEVHFNPVAPVLCDLLFLLPGVVFALRIEHKVSDGTVFEGGPRSPMAPGRLWHFLIMQNSDGTIFHCFPRERAQDDLRHAHRLPAEYLRAHRYEGSEVRRMIQDMVELAPLANQRTWQILNRLGEHSVDELASSGASNKKRAPQDDQALLTSMEAQVDHDTSDVDEDETSTSAPGSTGHPLGADLSKVKELAGRFYHAKGLPWLVLLINRWCCDRKYGIVFPLDVGHPWGTHVFVDFRWEEDDRKRFREGHLPYPIYHRQMQGRRCVVLRLADCQAPYILVGGMFDAHLMSQPVWQHSYLLLPSEHTTHSQHGIREAIDPDLPNRDRHYFRKILAELDDIPPFNHHARGDTGGYPALPLRKGSAFVKEGINPLQHIFSLDDGTLYRCLCDILLAPDQLRFHQAGSDEPGPEFRPKLYRTTIRRVLAATWQYGLYRKIAKADGSKMLGLARPRERRENAWYYQDKEED
ncbi:hypothetical protein KC349_g2984 [Hortaea werneckii]|nr:hypothetical protein KC349_g2984 [Hortaea werneckii]